MHRLKRKTLSLIFKNLTLNERTPFRLVSKRFKNACDSIPIGKLVIFHQSTPVAGKNSLTDLCLFRTDS